MQYRWKKGWRKCSFAEFTNTSVILLQGHNDTSQYLLSDHSGLCTLQILSYIIHSINRSNLIKSVFSQTDTVIPIAYLKKLALRRNLNPGVFFHPRFGLFLLCDLMPAPTPSDICYSVSFVLPKYVLYAHRSFTLLI